MPIKHAPPPETTEFACLQMLIEAVGQLWDCRPWEHRDDDELLTVEAHLGQRHTRFHASVMGSSGITQGVLLFPSAADAEAISSGNSAPPSACLSVSFVPRGEVPPPLLGQIRAAGWPRDAVRTPLCMAMIDGEVRPLDDLEMQLITLALEAVRAFNDDRRSGGRRRLLSGSLRAVGGWGRWRIWDTDAGTGRRRTLAPQVEELPHRESIAEVGLGVLSWAALEEMSERGHVLNEIPLIGDHNDGLPVVTLDCRGRVRSVTSAIMRLQPLLVLSEVTGQQRVVALITRRDARLLALTTPRDRAVQLFEKRRAALRGYHGLLIRAAGTDSTRDAHVILCRRVP
ncbi:MAG: hypothetical protein ACR2GX_01310 [Candidatus Dormibacteria bacterium]